MKIDEAEIRRRLKAANDLFRKEFREQRERLRMGLREIGAIFGVDSSTVACWESGRNIPYFGITIALNMMRELEPRENRSTFGKGNGPRKPRYSKEESEKFIALFKGQRKSLGLTFEKVAEILNVSLSTPHHWEHGIGHPTKLTWEYILETLANYSAEPRNPKV